MKKVPFYENLPDDLHCYQASLRMVLHYFLPKKNFTWKQLDKMTGQKKGLWTWAMRGVLALKDMGFDIIVDEEYTGKDSLVRETLEKLLMRESKGRWQGIVHIQQIGKHSPAHLLCWEYHRTAKKRRDIAKVSAADIMRLWQ